MGLQKAYRRGRRTEITIDTKFDPGPLTDHIDDMQRRSRNVRPVFQRIRDDLRKHWPENFTANGLPVGGWAPLDAEYGAWKAAHYPGAPPLVQTGQLFKSLSELRGSPNDIGRLRATFGTDIEHAKFHQMGTSKMPKRQIIYEPAEAQSRWGNWIADYIVHGSREDPMARWEVKT